MASTHCVDFDMRSFFLLPLCVGFKLIKLDRIFK